MASNNHNNFQAVPPIRTSTLDSQKSQSSGQMSPPTSPASPASRAATSPAEESFFGAITARMRRGRSRSRSRGAASRKRSKSPMMMPPEQLPHGTNNNAAQAQHTRHVSIPSPTSRTAAPTEQTRPSLQGTGRIGSDPWRGRHSNDWLFNGVSITNTAKELMQRRKS